MIRWRRVLALASARRGDFDMALDQTYNVSIDKPTSIIVAGLHADVCTDGRLSWRLVIRPNAP